MWWMELGALGAFNGGLTSHARTTKGAGLGSPLSECAKVSSLLYFRVLNQNTFLHSLWEAVPTLSTEKNALVSAFHCKLLDTFRYIRQMDCKFLFQLRSV